MVVVQGPENAPKKSAWYHAVWFVIVILLCAGPFGLPLLFKSDRFPLWAKVVITALVIWATVYATKATIDIVKTSMATFDELFSQM